MAIPRDLPSRLGLWSMLLLSLIAAAPGLYPGYWQTIEGFVPVFNVAQPAALANVAVTPDLWTGSGIGALLPAQPLLLLGFTPLTATRIVLMSCFILGPLALYAWLHPRLGDRAAGLAGIVYAFLPVSLAAVYRQGSLSDAIFLVLVPLALLGISTYATQRSLAGAAVGVAAILWMGRTQAGLAVVAAIVLMLYAWLVERRGSAVLTVAVAIAATLLWLYPSWGVHAEPATPFSSQFVSLYGLLRSGWRTAEPLQIGAAAFVLFLASVWALATGPVAWEIGVRRLVIFALSVSGAAILLLLPWSAPLWQVSRAEGLLRTPAQLALIAAPFLAAACGSVVLALEALRRPALWAALALVVILAASPDLQPVYAAATPPKMPAATFGNNDVLVLDARVHEQDNPHRAQLDVTWQALRPLKFDANLFFQALNESPSPAVIAQLDAPPLAETPSTAWQPGAIYTGTYTLDLPTESTASGAPLLYYFGLYDWRDGTRLPVNAGLDDKMVFHGQ